MTITYGAMVILALCIVFIGHDLIKANEKLDRIENRIYGLLKSMDEQEKILSDLKFKLRHIKEE